jgi:transcription initiation factor TFIID TATA-box-binding protein
MSFPDFDEEITRQELEDKGLIVSNIVATLDLNQELDLNALSMDVDIFEYHPETSPFLISRPIEGDTPTVLVPRNGQISVVGAKTKSELYNATEAFLSKLSDLEINVAGDPDDMVVRNIVVNGELGVELDLNVLTIAIGLESVEYNPEQFPGMIYRGGEKTTILAFRTGKFVITGSNSFIEAARAKDDFISLLESLDVVIE